MTQEKSAVVETPNVLTLLEQLHAQCLASEKRIFNATEHIRNRGLKFVLKTFVEQRARFAQELQMHLQRIADNSANDTNAAGSLGRGWTDIKATMTVQRRGRQQLVLAEAAAEEKSLMAAYADALAQQLPSAVRDLLQRHQTALRDSQRVLMMLAERTNQRLLVRLFNDRGVADRAVSQLREAGFTADDIYITPIEQSDFFAGEPQEQKRSFREVAMTSTLLGALLGLVLGLALAFAHLLYFPEIDGIFSTTPTGVFIELLLAGTVVGALFGTIFGLFMGYDAAEDDAYLYYESLIDGDILVAVSTDRAKSAAAERIIGLRHQFEVRPARASA